MPPAAVASSDLDAVEPGRYTRAPREDWDRSSCSVRSAPNRLRWNASGRIQTRRLTFGLPREARGVGRGPRFRPSPTSALVARAARVDGMRCERTSPAASVAHIEVFAANHVVVIPAGIGFAPPLGRRGAYSDREVRLPAAHPGTRPAWSWRRPVQPGGSRSSLTSGDNP